MEYMLNEMLDGQSAEDIVFHDITIVVSNDQE